jgi:TRAP transporter TAXI family solute receptor
MKMKKVPYFVLAVLAGVFFLSSSVTAAGNALGFGSGMPGSNSYSVASAVAKLLSEQAGILTVVQPCSGGTAFIPAVNAGEFDFGGANELELRYALGGTGYFKGQPMPNLRVVTVLMPLRTAIFVQKDSPIRAVKDLKGKVFPSDYTAMKVAQVITSGMLANAGLTWNDVKKDPVPNVVRGADDFIAGKADAFFFDVASGKVQEAASKVGGLRALPIDPSQEAMSRFRAQMPVAYPLLMQPSEALPAIVGPTYVAAFDLVLITSAKEPNDLIYKVTKALYNGKKALISYFKPFGEEFLQDKMAKVLPYGEYHQGAIKFYKEVGLWPPKEAEAGK